MGDLFKEFWLFLKEEKKWWLVPMLIVMGVVGTPGNDEVDVPTDTGAADEIVEDDSDDELASLRL